MATDPTADEVYARLRKAVATDGKQARRDFCTLVADPDAPLEAVLDLASRPGEGRVRHMIATSVRVDGLPASLLDRLQQWFEVESDEFARTAIRAAIAARGTTPEKPTVPAEMPPAFVEAYRYAADRLCHRVRNTLTVPTAMLVRLEQLRGLVQAPEVASELMDIVSRLRPALHRLSRVVEFDTGDGHFAWRSIPLGEWLAASAPGFASRFGQAEFTLISSPQARRLQVRATPFLLETTFGNLWTNAVQVAEELGLSRCSITAEITPDDGCIEVRLRDGGPGFPTEAVDSAFRMPFSTKGEARGRGLLEVADAVGRLQGKVRLLPVALNEHRVQIRFPVEES